MPFGLRNAPQTFQRVMDQILRGLSFAFVYIDDILIASNTCEEHLQHLEIVLQRLDEYGMTINIAKCEFMADQLDFLGHHLDADGIRPKQSKVSAIRQFPKPKTIKQLRQFLGMVNFTTDASKKLQKHSCHSMTSQPLREKVNAKILSRPKKLKLLLRRSKST